MNCPNCNREMREGHQFQGLVICPNCFKMVSHFIQKAKIELQQTFLVYTDMLRVALIEGKLRPPVLPKGEMPTADFKKAMLQALEVRNGKEATEPQHRRDMPGVRSGAQDRRPGLPSGAAFEAVRGRRKVRDVPPVQENHVEDHEDPRT